MAESGRGKQSFREFIKAVNELKRLTLSALKAGEQYTSSDLDEWYENLIDEYENTIRDNDIPNSELWLSRASDKAEADKAEIAFAYPNTELSLTGNDEEGDSSDSEETINPDEPDNILGIPIITAGECIDTGNSARGQIILTYEELIEYLEPIPPSVIMGLIPEFRDGELVGWRLCAAKET